MKQEVDVEALSAKERAILEAALHLLIETGDSGLTMRKLAEAVEMRLSNVQYYFKTRDDVLTAMIARYFDDCTETLVDLVRQSAARTARERVHFLVCAGLAHGRELSDMCRAFREIWAISSRNEGIERCMTDYYRRFADVVVDFVAPQDTSAIRRDRLKTLLIPFFEGYSITARALPLETDAAAEMLTDLAMAILEADNT